HNRRSEVNWRPVERLPAGGRDSSRWMAANRSSGLISKVCRHLVESGVKAATRQQFGVSPNFGDAAGVENDDPIGPSYGREPMCDDKGGAIAYQSFQRLEELVFG